MGEMLPLFPLGAVLYPGMLLPLHIFEERYRQLVQDLLEGPEPRRFGVIAIRKGRETGIDGVNGLKSLYEIGCTPPLPPPHPPDPPPSNLPTLPPHLSPPHRPPHTP